MIYDVIDGVLRIPEGDEYILEESYAHRDDIRAVYLPSSMKVIGPVAFMECKELTDVFLNEGLTEIGDGAFLGCSLLSLLKIPDSLKHIGPMAFWESGLNKIRIPSGVRVIGESAFWNNSSLKQVEVLGKDTIIERDAFGGCECLISGYIAPGFSSYDDAPSKLLYSILWASSAKRHDGDSSDEAFGFIRSNQMLVMEHIIKNNNIPALSGVLNEKLFDEQTLNCGLEDALKDNLTEISSMLLKAKSNLKNVNGTDEFEL